MGSDDNENPFNCTEDYADVDQVCQTTHFWEKKKKPTSLEQDIDMKTELKHRIQEAYQYADVLKNQMTTYDDPKWIKFILSSSHLNSIMHNIRTYLTATQTHEKRSSHTHPRNWKERLSQSFTLFHHC